MPKPGPFLLLVSTGDIFVGEECQSSFYGVVTITLSHTPTVHSKGLTFVLCDGNSKLLSYIQISKLLKSALLVGWQIGAAAINNSIDVPQKIRSRTTL